LFELVKSSNEFILNGYDIINQKYPIIENYDCFVISGSRYSCYEDVPWINNFKTFLLDIDKTDKKVVSICFGHQSSLTITVVLCEALGGKVEKNTNGWEVAATCIDFLPISKQYLKTEKQSFMIHEMHQDHVTVLPNGFISLASTAKSPNQLLLKPQKYLTIQGHPEFTSGFVRDLVEMRLEKGIFSKDFVQSLDIDSPVDSQWFAKVMIDFLEQNNATL
jgi:GMP synthase-like glutamine amidotransferase